MAITSHACVSGIKLLIPILVITCVVDWTNTAASTIPATKASSSNYLNAVENEPGNSLNRQGLVRRTRALETVSSPLVLYYPRWTTVTAECNNNTIFIEVHFHMPFNGIVFARGFRDTCSFEPPTTSSDSALETRDMTIQIPLNSQRNRDAVFCGPRVKSNGDVILALEVHEHKILETGGDRVFIVTCPAENTK